MSPSEIPPLASSAEVLDWLLESTSMFQMRVRQVPLRQLRNWWFVPGPLRLSHESGQFFSIVGIRHWATFGSTPEWDQPMIDQPEVGILGFLTKVIAGERCLLVQVKIEPGNTEGAQLAPTVQATRSNYTRVHGGRVPPYLDYFQDTSGSRVFVDQLQSEQTSRFLYKRNRNMLIEPMGEVPLLPRFKWIPWTVMTSMLGMDKTVNMDARSVISCVSYDHVFEARPDSKFAQALRGSMRDAQPSSMERVLHWFTRLRADFPRRSMIVGLDELAGWSVSEDEVGRADGRYFSVIGVEVETERREVSFWSQPLIKHHGRGLNGMITQQVDGTLRFLIRGCCYPGSMDNFQLGSTVSLSDYLSRIGGPGTPAFLEHFVDQDPKRIRHSSLQCEEGGRFLSYENRYIVIELDEGTIRDLPGGFVWMTLGEIYALMPHGYMSIEARNLLACLHAPLPLPSESADPSCSS